jgi:hypothetical protein
MKKTNGILDGKKEKRALARQQLAETRISELNSLPQMRQALEKILDYLDLPYQP